MDFMEWMESWSKHFLFCLTITSLRCFQIIIKGWSLIFSFLHILWRMFVLESTISLPNGVNANPAILKCCFPNGIPIMVMNNKIPKNTWVSQIHTPPIKNQMTFMIVLRQLGWPTAGRTREPNGQIQKMPSLIVCKPNGMPMIVTINPRLAIKYPIAVSAPPKINQMIFPSVFISLCFVICQIYDNSVNVVSF